MKKLIENKLDKIRRYYIRLMVLIIGDGCKKAEWLKKRKIFHHIGDNCFYKTTLLPAEPFLVCLHNNVSIAAGVRLVTHSITCEVFNKAKLGNFYCQHGKIEIHDNVFIGAGATIMYNVTIGSNCIIAAGAVVTKDVPSGSVVGGCPAKIICSFDESLNKAKEYSDYLMSQGLDPSIKSYSVRDLLKYKPVKFDIDEQ